VKPSTLTRRLSAISQAHQLAGLESPTHDMKVRTLMAGIRRAKGMAPSAKHPLRTEELRRMLRRLPNSFQGLRDRALLLVGFAAALRRSELVALNVEDLAFSADGLVVSQRRSKTDQEGQGRQIGVPFGAHSETCPVRSAQAWVEFLDETSGPLFRPIDRHNHVSPRRLSDRAVALILKRAAARVDLDPAGLAGHSLRAGLATSAAAAGVPERIIMAQTGHRSLPALRRYIREGSLFRENAAGKVGL
jgi:integrase